MAGFGGFTIVDYTRETSRTSFNTGNITAVSLPATLTQFGALRGAIENIILGVVKQEYLQVFNTRLSNVLPGDINAQVERKWLVTYEDNQAFFDAPANLIPNAAFGKVYSFEIGTADLAAVTFQGTTDEVDIAVGAAATFVTAFEAIARSPYGGTVRVLEMTHVGARR